MLSVLLGSLVAVAFVSRVAANCVEECFPADETSDCCEYYGTAIYEGCAADGNTEYFTNCVSDNSSVGSNSSVFDCKLGFDVDFVGKSGQFKLYPCNDTNFFIKVNLLTIQAYDSDGSKQATNKVTSFAYASAVSGDYSSGDSSVYNWQDGDGNDKTLGGVTLDYYFEVNDEIVKFLLNLYVIDDITIIEYTNDNETFTEELSQGTLKFDFEIDNWPFENDDDMLEISIRLTTGGTQNDGSDGGSNDGSQTFSWGDDFVINMPLTYSHSSGNDTVGKDVEVSFDATGSGKQVDISYLFVDAGYADTIIYDPSMTYSTNSDSEGESQQDKGYCKKHLSHINIIIFITLLFVWQL